MRLKRKSNLDRHLHTSTNKSGRKGTDSVESATTSNRLKTRIQSAHHINHSELRERKPSRLKILLVEGSNLSDDYASTTKTKMTGIEYFNKK
mmetsp:Transcript_22181/g.25482  ORF Transcript_22181/g.25482 Transcript_22181/m.25482 type:complete len:92 (-) Transcript_22181:125-400(-)